MKQELRRSSAIKLVIGHRRTAQYPFHSGKVEKEFDFCLRPIFEEELILFALQNYWLSFAASFKLTLHFLRSVV
jgi:hypothetical protein